MQLYVLLLNECNNLISTWSDNHSDHTSKYYHCALQRCVSEDYPGQAITTSVEL